MLGSPKESPSGEAKPLVLGQPSAEKQEITRWEKTGKFVITPQKVVEGKPEDLKELGDDAKYAGQKLAWVYVDVKHAGGDDVKGPMVMTDVGVEVVGGRKATRLILMGDLRSRPQDCRDEDTEASFKQGDSRTACEPYLIPATAKVEKVTYSQGYYKEPLAWQVP
ncbi:hypothetical protein [Streptomyces venezuelae]|uniref:hypothetical protein n=1 Tax=Streptomyces venezuelae TaxID=54571 RepID=UPI00331C1378